MIVKDMTYRGRTFKVAQGSLHPEFSFYTFEEEEREIRDRYWNVEAGDVVVDVGASYGSYTLTACAMGALVYAVEPEPLVFDDLLRNLRLNDWLYTRCFAYNVGLWDSSERVDMRTYAPHWPAHTISGEYQMTTLDRLLESGAPAPSRVDWIKVDAEGAEEHVLAGALATIEKYHPRLLVECHVFLDPRIDTRIEFALKILGYQVERIPRDPAVMLYAAPVVI